jgi:hypothetical protein
MTSPLDDSGQLRIQRRSQRHDNRLPTYRRAGSLRVGRRVAARIAVVRMGLWSPFIG